MLRHLGFFFFFVSAEHESRARLANFKERIVVCCCRRVMLSRGRRHNYRASEPLPLLGCRARAFEFACKTPVGIPETQQRLIRAAESNAHRPNFWSVAGQNVLGSRVPGAGCRAEARCSLGMGVKVGSLVPAENVLVRVVPAVVLLPPPPSSLSPKLSTLFTSAPNPFVATSKSSAHGRARITISARYARTLPVANQFCHFVCL
jgi:hypothetical protein